MSGKGKPARRVVNAPSVPASGAQARPQLDGMAEQPPVQPVRPASPRVTARPARTAANIIPTNYDYVVSDLKRIGVIAGAMLAVLIVLTVIIR